MRKDVAKAFVIAVILLNAGIVFINSLADLSFASSSLSTDKPCVHVYPEETVASVGSTFTISVSIFNLTNSYTMDPVTPGLQVPLGNLFGFDINLTWNPAKLDYVSHIVTVPVEDYPNGVLHTDPDLGVQQLFDIVDPDAGTYHVGFACFYMAPVFNNPGKSNTVFNMTFTMLEQGASYLRLTGTELSAKPQPNVSMRILHAKFDGYVETPGTPRAKFTVWPPDGKAAKNQAVAFNASESYDPDGYIDSYHWNFGDGVTTSGKIVTHPYSTTGRFTVTLVVVDDDGISSGPATKTLTVVENRDLAVTAITPSHEVILQNRTVEVDFSVKNLGDVPENYTVTVSYNQTVIDWNNLASAGWAQIGKKSGVNLGSKSEIGLSLNWSTIGVPPAIYYLMANASLAPSDTNSTNNIRTSSAVEVATEIRHDVAVISIDVSVIKGAHEFEPPLIVGENGTISTIVKARQTANETFSATLKLLAPDGTVSDSKSWLSQSVLSGETKELQFASTKWVAGSCTIALNLTILEVDKNETNNNAAMVIKVVNPPVLVIGSLPIPIYEGDPVSLNAAASTQQGGSLTYRWRMWEPLLNPLTATATSTVTGATVNYVFSKTGNWTVILSVTDEDGITYDVFRDATASYQKTLIVKVDAKPGMSFDLIYVVVGVIAAVIVGGYAYLRLKRPKPT